MTLVAAEDIVVEDTVAVGEEDTVVVVAVEDTVVDVVEDTVVVGEEDTVVDDSVVVLVVAAQDAAGFAACKAVAVDTLVAVGCADVVEVVVESFPH